MTEIKFGQAKPEAKPVVVPANPPQPAKPVSVPAGGTIELGGSIPVAVPETKPAPAPQPAPEPAAQDKPATTAPAEPVDLEGLANPNANPSSKGQSK